MQIAVINQCVCLCVSLCVAMRPQMERADHRNTRQLSGKRASERNTHTQLFIQTRHKFGVTVYHFIRPPP